MISIRIIKICDTSICRPLKLIFQRCLKSGKLPTEWKKANVVPVHKKGGYKNLVSNKTQYYSDEFKKRRHELKDCEDFQPCRKSIAEELAVHLIIDFKTVKAAELKTKLGFNQVGLIMSKQASIGSRLKKTFFV